MDTFDPGRPDFKPYGFTCVRWQPSVMKRPDHHNEVELNYLCDGWVTYLLGGHKVRIESGRLGVFWAAIPHQIIDFSKAVHFYVATIPFAWFLQCRLPENLSKPLLQGAFLVDPVSSPNPRDPPMFERWIHDMASPVSEIRRAVMLEMEARLLRLGLNLTTQKPLENEQILLKNQMLNKGGLNKMEQIATFMAKNYQEKLTAAAIGKSVGLHPNYIMGLFQKTFGITLTEFLTQLRISHAQRLLVTTNDKVVDIAFDSGFRSISRFNEAFRKQCGCTPREYRNKHEYL